ncbi:sugar transporter [Medicago truncatula]|uniref:Sugar transporter n=1 Tax=Medicago truncatula TaxID=3880 RepID=G7KSZ4_MEDTR|nr:sugar transporter [Medicago truncatula]
MYDTLIVISIRHLDQDWLHDIYLLQLHSISRYILTKNITTSSFIPNLYVHDVGAVSTLAVTGILVYIGSFSIGMGAIPWVVMSEIFPVNIKGQAGSIATIVNWFGAWLCSYTFNFLMSWSSYVAVVPETKGKSLEQLQAAINA